jgi:hypothetical protein
MYSYYLRFCILVVLGLSLSGCSSYFIKKDCERLNWYQVGYDSALRGERISNDAHVSKCRKVEAEISESQLDLGFKAGMGRYCQPDGAFQTGRGGELFNNDFCDSQTLPQLLQKHREGLAGYCSDGYTAGTSGKKYKNVCQIQQEKTFLPEYKKGRRKYLSGLIQHHEEKINFAQQDLQKIQTNKLAAERRLYLLPPAVSGQADPYINQRSQINQDLSQLNQQSYSKQSELKKSRDEISRLKEELLTLE